MKKAVIALAAVFGVFLLIAAGLVIYGIQTLNSFASMDETVSAAWAQVENQYQRRADLIPNLVNTVKGYAAHEKDTLTQVIEARSQAINAQKPSANLNEQTLNSYQKAQDGLTSALDRLLVVVEKYPDLKANENFLALQTQLEGTENRIAVARKDYIQVVQVYNIKLRQIPGGWIAKTFGSYQLKPVFAAQEGAQNAPTVSF